MSSLTLLKSFLRSSRTWRSSSSLYTSAAVARFYSSTASSSKKGSGVVTSVDKVIKKPYDPSLIRPKKSQESKVLVRYPLSSSLAVLNEYLRHDGGIRLGKLQEDMDSTSGDVAERHCFMSWTNGENEVPMNVTGCVDRINIYPKNIPKKISWSIDQETNIGKGGDKDILIDGQMIWTGNSSMLIRVKVWAIDANWGANMFEYYEGSDADEKNGVDKFKTDLSLAEHKDIIGKKVPPNRLKEETSTSQKRIYKIAARNQYPDIFGQENTWNTPDELIQRLMPPEQNRALMMESDFLFVALDRRTRKGVKINPLLLNEDSWDEKIMFDEGEASRDERKQKAKVSLMKTIPRPEEVVYLHQFYLDGRLGRSRGVRDDLDIFDLVKSSNTGLDTSNCGVMSRDSNVLPSVVALSNTRFRSIFKTQPQEQNSGGKIFGGQLMRQAFELAYQNIALFMCYTEGKEKVELVAPGLDSNGSGPGSKSDSDSVASSGSWSLSTIEPVCVDDVLFARPVSIGSEICFTGHVTYTKGNLAHLSVTAEIYDYKDGEAFLSNNFSYIFRNSSGKDFAHVIPLKYSDMMRHIEGRRSVKEYLQSGRTSNLSQTQSK